MERARRGGKASSVCVRLVGIMDSLGAFSLGLVLLEMAPPIFIFFQSSLTMNSNLSVPDSFMSVKDFARDGARRRGCSGAELGDDPVTRIDEAGSSSASDPKTRISKLSVLDGVGGGLDASGGSTLAGESMRACRKSFKSPEDLLFRMGDGGGTHSPLIKVVHFCMAW
jgi:hypothetical protein